MRYDIVHPQADELVYEIRWMVLLAKQIEAAGVRMTWENIGDPVAKGEQVPAWIVEHLEAVAGLALRLEAVRPGWSGAMVSPWPG